MKRFFLALIISHSFLLASNQPKYLYPYIYYLPHINCFDHLSKDPVGCSSHAFVGGQLMVDFKRNAGTREYNQLYVDPQLVNRVASLSYLIPVDENVTCQYAFCNRCCSVVARMAKEDLEDGDPDDPFLFRACRCMRSFHEDHSRLSWVYCDNGHIENCYFQWHNQQYFHFFEQFLSYLAENPECQCYWPQINKNAYQVSNLVHTHMAEDRYDNFLWDLFQGETRFPYVPNSQSSGILHSIEAVTQALFAHAFFYSHYRQIFLDVCTLVDEKRELIERKGGYRFPIGAEIMDASYTVLDKIKPLLLNMYNQCLAKHPHPKIYYERGLVHMHLGEASSALEDMQHLITYAEASQQDLLASEIYHQEGSAYADLGMFDQALAALSTAIEKNPQNKNAYFDRAATYFELGNFEQSLSDYLASGLKPDFSHKGVDLNESLALVEGIISGMGIGAQGYLPNLLDGVVFIGKGLSEALWAYGTDSLQASIDLAHAVYQCGEFIATQPILNTVGVAFPEVKKLVDSWGGLSKIERTKQAGFIFGKYGVEICIDIAATKGIAAAVRVTRNLKKANNLLNCEALKVGTATMKAKAIEANNRTIAEWEKALTRISPTRANATKGWSVGDSIYNLTKEGKVPKWSAVRQRYWKNKAQWAVSNHHDFNPKNLARMEQGLAPQRFNQKTGLWESRELHHVPPQKDGGLFDFMEVWPDEHAAVDSFRYIRK